MKDQTTRTIRARAYVHSHGGSGLLASGLIRVMEGNGIGASPCHCYLPHEQFTGLIALVPTGACRFTS
jgi:hypothetical protein